MLTKAVQLLGVNCDVNHIETGTVVDGPHIFIRRDPRNVVVSWLRFTGKPVTQGTFICALNDFYQGRTVRDSLSRYVGWLDEPSAMVVSFEDFTEATMKRIAEHIGVPYLDDAYDALPGGTFSWTGKHSDYRTIWTPEVKRAWDEAGGAEMLEQWGY